MLGSVESVTGKRCCTQSSMAMLPQEFQVKTAASPWRDDLDRCVLDVDGGDIGPV